MDSNDMLWNAPTPAPQRSKPGEHGWSLHKNGRRLDCELRFHGESTPETPFIRSDLFALTRLE